jgi:predicted small lipoprotein YifL
MKPTTMLIITLLVALAACGEKPQRVMTESESAAANETNRDDLRERTLRQSESRRMAY